MISVGGWWDVQEALEDMIDRPDLVSTVRYEPQRLWEWAAHGRCGDARYAE